MSYFNPATRSPSLAVMYVTRKGIYFVIDFNFKDFASLISAHEIPVDAVLLQATLFPKEEKDQLIGLKPRFMREKPPCKGMQRLFARELMRSLPPGIELQESF